MKKFLKDLQNALKKLKVSNEEVEEILSDHEEMINEALNQGLSEEEISNKFGDPMKVAQDLYNDLNKVEVDVNKYVQDSEFSSIKDFEIFKVFPVTDLKEIIVKLVSEDIEIYPYEGQNIEVHYHKVKNLDKYETSLENGVFKLIRKTGLNVNVFNRDNGDFVVRYPNVGKLENYDIKSVSGDCDLKGIATSKLKLKSTSGDFEVTGIVVTEPTEFTTVSGDFEVVDANLKSVKMNTVSGDFECKDLKIDEDIDMNTVSGDFEFLNVSANSAVFNSVSGDLEANEFYVEKIDLKSVSGDVEISNTDKTRPITVGRKRSLSGDISINQ
ncbi:hypothetical protein KQ51_00409 [Candidatus Izimaplasma bacterium HR1]|uniref:DUF4097 family beta strand repeat-containing protein n=1 Tax=Candidatus Izimoplasma sp. HR1 TaxID=1541959 RepID=UPI0004F59AAA|nr:hypothetical protein KQ51_00409 [Candidatus Izimaplasma bacterium HR1]